MTHGDNFGAAGPPADSPVNFRASRAWPHQTGEAEKTEALERLGLCLEPYGDAREDRSRRANCGDTLIRIYTGMIKCGDNLIRIRTGIITHGDNLLRICAGITY